VIERIAVVGAGTMGHGITAVAAMAGAHVALADEDPVAPAAALIRIGAALDRAIERGKLKSADRAAALGRVRAASGLADAVRDADLVIEAIPERLDLKQALFRDLERHAPAGAILATNTSSLSVSSIAQAVSTPERVVGMHFFNPVPAMKLVEIVRGRDTSDATIAAARGIAEWLGKTPIVVRDSPGFATSRLGVVLGLEAIRMLEEGVAAAEDIDRAMELGYNHPMGPLRLGDLVGLDVRLAIADHLHATLGGDIYAAPELLRRMVAEGRLGRKTGEGFYRW
jgi:3-hydroxybutyryl-CoA dehydrogenase